MSFNGGVFLDVKDFLCRVHACTVACPRAIVDLLTEKSLCWTLEQFATAFAVNGDQVVRARYKAKAAGFAFVNLRVHIF